MKKILFLFLIVTVSSQTGCSMWNNSLVNRDSDKNHVGSKESSLTDRTLNEDDFPDEDDWSIVGEEGRGRKTLSRNPEKTSIIDKYFITDKTRQIEQNLGIY